MKVQACPFCNRNLFNRLVDRCGYCGKELPGEFCLSDTEKADLKIEKTHQFHQIKKSYNLHNKLYIRTINANLNGEGIYLIEPQEASDE